MSDVDHEDEFEKAFEGFGEDPAPVTPPATPPADPPATPPADDKKDDATATPPEPNKAPEEPKKDEQPPADPKKEDEETPPKPTDEKKPEDGTKPPENPAPQTPPEEPKPLTKDDVTSIIRDIRTEERDAGKELQTVTNEVLEAYYPDGLSNVLVTPEGKELKTPQDVVDASGGQMSTEEAAQWLMNEQYKLDQEVNKIKADAQKIAETTISFKRDSVAALTRYEPLFKAYPHLQKKAFDLLMKQTKVDEKKGVILAAPDVMDLYDTYLEPYQLAFEQATNQPATNPNPAAPTPPAPGADDRLDEGGDGGPAPVNDPNDFAQQVTKELAKGEI